MLAVVFRPRVTIQLKHRAGRELAQGTLPLALLCLDAFGVQPLSGQHLALVQVPIVAGPEVGTIFRLYACCSLGEQAVARLLVVVIGKGDRLQGGVPLRLKLLHTGSSNHGRIVAVFRDSGAGFAEALLMVSHDPDMAILVVLRSEEHTSELQSR